ncbi:helix-turn-helix transcriptional regulator [Planotetraspora kaengkrachanensis]|nr:helix-turn-helix transcriptional regulator [Planotetraspora kaengkrachanensis]
MRNPLGQFLRARRHLTTPDRVGLTRVGDHRRTPGLRREEVAMLAGVSIDYYTRLEQGRQRHPSDQVLSALACVLQLDSEATEHLHHLAHPLTRKRGSVRGVEQVDSTTLRLMDSWDHAPARVVNHRLDVLAQNPLNVALYEGLGYSDNLIRLTFLDPAAREFYPDWEQEACDKVAHLHAALGAYRDDPALSELVKELSLASEDFRQKWARYDVGCWACSHRTRRFHHRAVGAMTLRFQAFAVNHVAGQQLIVSQAEPGSPSENAVVKLAALNVSHR